MSLLANPLRNPELLDIAVISGRMAPGLFRLVDGGSRAYKWDVKDSAGAQGSTETYRGFKPSDGINGRFEFWTAEQIDEFYQVIIPLLKYDGTKKDPLPIALHHPVLYANDITQVVVEDIGPLKDLGAQLWSVTVKFLEYRPAKKANVTSTPAKLGREFHPDPNANTTPTAADAQDRELEALLAEARKPFGAPERAAAQAPVPPATVITPDLS